MESQRQSFYKEYTNNKDDKPSTSQGSVGRKRKNLSEDVNSAQSDHEKEFKVPKALKISTENNTSKEVPVTKLRRANTIDYVSLGMAHSSRSNQPNLPLVSDTTDILSSHQQEGTLDDHALPQVSDTTNMLSSHQQEGTLDDHALPQVSDTNNTLSSHQQEGTLDDHALPQVSDTNNTLSSHQQEGTLDDHALPQVSDTTDMLSSHQQEGTLDDHVLPQVSDTNNTLSSHQQEGTLDDHVLPQVSDTNNTLSSHQQEGTLDDHALPQVSDTNNTLSSHQQEGTLDDHVLPQVSDTTDMLSSHQEEGTFDNHALPQVSDITDMLSSHQEECTLDDHTLLQVSDTEDLSTTTQDRTTQRQQEIEKCIQEIRTEDQQVIVIELEEIENSENQKKNNNYKYIDFLSEDETFSFSSSWEEESFAGDANKTKRKKKQRKKSKQLKKTTEEENNTTIEEENKMVEKEIMKNKKKRTNKAKERSLSFKAGREYITKSGKFVEARVMKNNPCTPDNCVNKCYEVPEIRRKNIFDHYWSLNKERRKDWLINNSKKEKVKRKRVKDIESRRQFTYSYFINEGEGKKAVCLKFLLNTIDIKQKFLHNSITNSSMGTSNEDKRGKRAPGNKTSETLLQTVKNYIENLPAVPSHYCRKNSKKFYLPQEFRNLSNLYKIYKETQQSAGTDFVGEKVFKNIFIKDYNIAFHIPRKDKCLKCIKYQNETSNTVQKEKEMHLKDKEETFRRFSVHQNLRHHDDSILCVTFDLQKVLNTPYGESMLLYYSRKLAVYNLTFYESVTRDGFCYTWSEDQGKRGANEVCTILAKYIEKVDYRGNIKRLLLYCDSCPGQNKNKIVLACISRCLNTCRNITSIQINYLLPGHTFMPVDSMHSVIEKSTTNTIIWAPSQWPTVFELARKNPGPYYVEVLQYKDFAAWDALGGYFKGNMVGKISKVRVATFRKSAPNTIQVKYSMDTEAEAEEIDIVQKKNDTTPKQLYKSPLPISKKKYTDLVKLCTNKTIPERFHHEYIQLQSASNVQDVLEDSDIEDGDKD